MNNFGIVIIGRNEGERLVRCVASVADAGAPIVYVDSGSTDASVPTARAAGAEVVELDTSKPFSAARARNAGFDRLMALAPQTQFVQFIDGDCEIIGTWFQKAIASLSSNPRYGIVCGRLRERFPDRSIYNRLCQIEWDGPVGQIDICGGIFVIRAEAFRAVGKFNETLPAGEEPELCLRLRQNEWQLFRLPDEMALHDAAMHHFGQWWKRTIRGGHAYAQVSWVCRHTPGRMWSRDSRKIFIVGLLIPAVALALAWPSHSWSLLLLGLYPLLILKLAVNQYRQGRSKRDAFLYAVAIIMGKFPQALGQLRFWRDHLLKNEHSILEYKSIPAAVATK